MCMCKALSLTVVQISSLCNTECRDDSSSCNDVDKFESSLHVQMYYYAPGPRNHKRFEPRLNIFNTAGLNLNKIEPENITIYQYVTIKVHDVSLRRVS